MYFKIMNSSNGQFYFTINADNHEALCHSETYVQKQSALHAIDIIKGDAASAKVVDNT